MYEEYDIAGIEQKLYYGFRYYLLEEADLKNGPGIRAVLWVSGCSHRCRECQNPFTWDSETGMDFTLEQQSRLFDVLKDDAVGGLTISGGDPLFFRNRNGIGRLVKEVKRAYPEKTIWLYTGYTLKLHKEGIWFETEYPDRSECFQLDWIEQLDVVVDGKFDAERRKEDLRRGIDPQWVGSSNQRVIDIPATIETKNIVLWEQDVPKLIQEWGSLYNELLYNQLGYGKEDAYGFGD